MTAPHPVSLWQRASLPRRCKSPLPSARLRDHAVASLSCPCWAADPVTLAASAGSWDPAPPWRARPSRSRGRSPCSGPAAGSRRGPTRGPTALSCPQRGRRGQPGNGRNKGPRQRAWGKQQQQSRPARRHGRNDPAGTDTARAKAAGGEGAALRPGGARAAAILGPPPSPE